MSSILIRKYCQPILDDAGYPMFYCTLDDNHYAPSMEIYTLCGKKMVQVHGVTFSRAKPTIAECEYSAVLLQGWLDRHAADFEAYVDAYVEFHSTKPPKFKDRKKGVEIKISERVNKIVTISRTYPNPNDPKCEDTFWLNLTVQLPYPFTIYNIQWPGNIGLTSADITAKLKVPKSLIDAAEQLLTEKETYTKMIKVFEEATAKINTCEI